MFQAALSEEASFNPLLLQNTNIITPPQQPPPPPPKKPKKRRSLPGNPDPDAEVIALSPKSLLTTNRFICEICNKGFQRDQNLQLHRRGHNLPWKLKQRSKTEVVRKKAYVCPEPTCVHHHPSRALGDLTGIKKHFCRKHGEKKYKCEKCSKIYAVQSDWKAHSKTCGTREYRCDCGTLFSRKDSFITHRAFCDALAEESARFSSNPFTNPIIPSPPPPPPPPLFSTLSAASQNPNSHLFPFPSPWDQFRTLQNPNNPNPNPSHNPLIQIKTELNNPNHQFSPPPPPYTFQQPPFTGPDSTQFLSATALLQKAVTMGPVTMGGPQSLASLAAATWGKNNDGFTRDFLGLAAGDHYGRGEEEFTGGLQYGMTATYDGDNSSSSSSVLLFKPDDHHHHHHPHHHHHHEIDDHGFGTFITAQPPPPTSALESRWG